MYAKLVELLEALVSVTVVHESRALHLRGGGDALDRGRGVIIIDGAGTGGSAHGQRVSLVGLIDGVGRSRHGHGKGGHASGHGDDTGGEGDTVAESGTGQRAGVVGASHRWH